MSFLFNLPLPLRFDNSIILLVHNIHFQNSAYDTLASQFAKHSVINYIIYKVFQLYEELFNFQFKESLRSEELSEKTFHFYQVDIQGKFSVFHAWLNKVFRKILLRWLRDFGIEFIELSNGDVIAYVDKNTYLFITFFAIPRIMVILSSHSISLFQFKIIIEKLKLNRIGILFLHNGFDILVILKSNYVIAINFFEDNIHTLEFWNGKVSVSNVISCIKP